ncbi:unnamed protein product, partial [Polarella glacialis]
SESCRSQLETRSATGCPQNASGDASQLDIMWKSTKEARKDGLLQGSRRPQRNHGGKPWMPQQVPRSSLAGLTRSCRQSCRMRPWWVFTCCGRFRQTTKRRLILLWKCPFLEFE